MIIECHSNNGFEDQLTLGAEYQVTEVGVNSFLIENDREQKFWYGTLHFNISLQDGRD